MAAAHVLGRARVAAARMVPHRPLPTPRLSMRARAPAWCTRRSLHCHAFRPRILGQGLRLLPAAAAAAAAAARAPFTSLAVRRAAVATPSARRGAGVASTFVVQRGVWRATAARCGRQQQQSVVVRAMSHAGGGGGGGAAQAAVTRMGPVRRAYQYWREHSALLKATFKTYGAVAIIVYFGGYFVTLGTLFTLVHYKVIQGPDISKWLDPTTNKYLRRFTQEPITLPPLLEDYFIAWLIAKTTEPARVFGTVAIVPAVVRWLPVVWLRRLHVRVPYARLRAHVRQLPATQRMARRQPLPLHNSLSSRSSGSVSGVSGGAPQVARGSATTPRAR